MHDADILEQLGAIGILRAVSKVGRDTRYPTHAGAVNVLRRNVETLPQQLQLPEALQIAAARLAVLNTFLAAIEMEAMGVDL